MREAELSVTDQQLGAIGVADLLSVFRDAGILDVEELACHGTGAVLQVVVEERVEEAELDDIAPVETWSHVAERDRSHVYVVSFTVSTLPESLEDRATELVGTCDPDVGERGATMSLVGPHDAISGQIRDYEDVGVSPDLERIGGYAGPDYPLDDLTDRQREVVETAWEMGYYEVPKDVSADEVAAELDLDSSTVNEHLQRAERNLLSQLL